MPHIEDILERASRLAEAAEVFFEEGETREVVFENNRLKCITTKEECGVGLRVIKHGRIGFSSTTDFSKSERLVLNALASAEFGQEAKFTFPDRCTPADVDVFDQAVVSHPIPNAMDEGKAAIDAVLATAPDVQCSASVDKAVSTARLLNTRGLDLEVQFTAYGLGLYALRVQGESFLEIGEGEEHRARKGSLKKQAEKVIEKLALCRKEISLETCTLPVIFMPKAMDILLDTFLMGTNGKTVQKGASPLTGKIGEKLLDERVHLFDNPTVDLAPGSTPLDTEGIGCRRIPLFEAGVLKNFVLDMQTAGMMGLRSTGHGTRGIMLQPTPAHTNIMLSPGVMRVEDMLAEMDRGLIVEQVLGEGQSNVLAGEFSVNLDLAFLVEKGEIVGRVKDCMLTGNVFDLWKDRIIALGSVAEWHGALNAPPVLFDAISVAGTG